jgi:hypothetical protein
LYRLLPGQKGQKEKEGDKKINSSHENLMNGDEDVGKEVTQGRRHVMLTNVRKESIIIRKEDITRINVVLDSEQDFLSQI